MILTPEETIRRHVASRAWSRVTLDQLFRRGVERDPGGIAFRNVGPAAVPGLQGSLTFAEAERRIEALASFFAGVGMKPDTVLGIHLPPSAEAAIVMLGALRAGLILCPLPLHFTRAEMADAVQAANIRAIATASEIEGEATGEAVRDVAAAAFAIRFVFAVGTAVPDGLIDLAAVLADLDQFGPSPPIPRRGAPADHIALLSLMRGEDDRLVIAPLAHNHLVAGALAHALEGGLAPGETILSTHHPASLAGLSGALASAVVGGGTLAFHHVVTLAGLVEAAAESEAHRVVLPAPIGPAAAKVLPDTVAVSLVSTGCEPEGIPDMPARRGTVDLVTLGGLCLLPLARPDAGTAPLLPAGLVRIPRAGANSPIFYETRLKARQRQGDRRITGGAGELIVSGALVPDAPWPEPASGGSGASLAIGSDGAIRTGLLVQPSSDGRALRLRGPVADLLVVAGRTLSPSRLETLARGCPGVADAAVFPVEAPHVGSRLGVAVVVAPGEVVDREAVAAALAGEDGSLDAPAVVTIVDVIPRTTDGRVLREALFMAAVA